MGRLVNEYLSNREFKKKSVRRSLAWQMRRTNIVLEFLRYAELKNVPRLKDIGEPMYSGYINRLTREGKGKKTITRYKSIIKKDLLGHFRPVK